MSASRWYNDGSKLEGKDPMSKQESTKEIIDSYRKKQNQSWQNIALFVGTALLIVLGAAFLITWLTGSRISMGGLFASKTPTPTMTFTPSPVPPTATITLTPTESVPTDTPEPSPTPTRSGAVIYIAEENDTFSSIAERFDIDIFTLLVYNAGEDRLNLDLAWSRRLVQLYRPQPRSPLMFCPVSGWNIWSGPGIQWARSLFSCAALSTISLNITNLMTRTPFIRDRSSWFA